MGYNYNGTVSDSYSTGSVTGRGSNVGGLVGWNSGGTVSDSYSTGSVTGRGSNVGGLVGYNNGGTVTDSYWDTATSGHGGSSGGTGLTTSQLVSALPAGFSNTIWGDATGQTTPYLLSDSSFGTVSGYVIPYTEDSSASPTLYGVILTPTQLQNINTTGLSNDYVLGTDINLSGASFTPIGESSAFTGTFNGLGNTISNLIIGTSGTKYSGTYAGLFGQVGSGGTVENIGLLNENIYGNNSFGNTTGGLVGYNSGLVTDSYSTGSVKGTNSVGGLVGYNSGLVTDSYSTGSVTGGNYVGGLMGVNAGTVSDSYSTGSVYGTAGYVGGLMGVNAGTVSDSYSTGNVSGTNYVGGLVGYNSGGTVTDSYSTGSVTGTGSANYTGGLVGGNTSGGTVTDSYSTGSVTGRGSNVGGLVGYNSGGTVTDSYWDTTTSGRGSSSGGTGLTDSQMKQLSSFSAWGSSIINKGSSYVNSAATPWFIYNGETYPLLTAFMTPITVTANNASSTYNGSPYTAAPTGVTYNGSSAEPSNILGTLGYGSPTNVGTYGLTGLYSDQQGYIISYGMGELTINPAPLTVTANNYSYTYNGKPYLGGNGVTYSGFVGGQNSSVLSGTLTYSGTSQGAVKAGTYTIIPGGLSDANGDYALFFVNGILTINSVYSDVFQAFIGSVPNGKNNANETDNILIPILTSYEGSGSLPNIPPLWKGGKIINELYNNGFNSKYNYNFNYYRHKHHKSRKHYVK